MVVSLKTAQDLIGEPLDTFVVQSVGIAFSGEVVGQLSQFTGGLQDELVQALAGIGLVKFGGRVHKLVPEFGTGILKQLAATLISGGLRGGGGAIFGQRGGGLFGEV